MKIRMYCDSGANIHSCREDIVNVEDYFGISAEEWKAYSEQDKEQLVKDWMYNCLEWGWEEIDEN